MRITFIKCIKFEHIKTHSEFYRLDFKQLARTIIKKEAF